MVNLIHRSHVVGQGNAYGLLRKQDPDEFRLVKLPEDWGVSSNGCFMGRALTYMGKGKWEPEGYCYDSGYRLTAYGTLFDLMCEVTEKVLLWDLASMA